MHSLSLLPLSSPPIRPLPAPPLRRRPSLLSLSPLPLSLFSLLTPPPPPSFSPPHRRRCYRGSATAADLPSPPSCRGSGFAALLRQSGCLRTTVDRCSLPPHLSLFSPLFTVAPPSPLWIAAVAGSPQPPSRRISPLQPPTPISERYNRFKFVAVRAEVLDFLRTHDV
ncbi:proline-rich receptor-like protein kinase PERK2 [Salvia splendens]|uniref:proline-rich receptor-like protein kinase PERK2 n=1 Tax=Salvia splendens TaxID=180675 RepID=UPI001C27CF2A|nr:proline-rich receptor-like protein kinase PERK2 [Salvia splendens]